MERRKTAQLSADAWPAASFHVPREVCRCRQAPCDRVDSGGDSGKDTGIAQALTTGVPICPGDMHLLGQRPYRHAAVATHRIDYAFIDRVHTSPIHASTICLIAVVVTCFTFYRMYHIR